MACPSPVPEAIPIHAEPCPCPAPGLTGRYVSTYELSWGAAAAVAPMAFGRGYDVAPALPWPIAAAVTAGVALGFRQERGVIRKG